MPIYLREWRELAGRTQEQVAEAVEKSVPTVQRWEAGKRVPGLDDIERLAQYLERRPGDLLSSPKEVLGSNETDIPFDEVIFKIAVSEVEAFLAKRPQGIPPDRKADVLVASYQIALKYGHVDEEVIEQLVRMAR